MNNSNMQKNLERHAHPPYQPDPLLGWLLTLLYWCICLFVGVLLGYPRKLANQWKQISIYSHEADPKQPENDLHLWIISFIGMFVVVRAQRRIRTRYTAFGRPPCETARWVFGLVNGVLETFMFAAVYSFGSGCCFLLFGGYTFDFPPPPALVNYLSISVGFSVLLVYLGLIHALFWAPCVFPKHVRENAPPFHKHALLPLTAITVAIIVPFINWGNLVIPSLLHVYLDLDAAKTMNLPGPFAKIFDQL